MTAGNDTRPGAPERIWIKADVDRSEGGDFAWFTPFVPSQPSIEYVRADALSPAASEGEGWRDEVETLQVHLNIIHSNSTMATKRDFQEYAKACFDASLRRSSVIAAALRPAASEGDGVEAWQLVPKTITPEMRTAYTKLFAREKGQVAFPIVTTQDALDALLSSAPKPPQSLSQQKPDTIIDQVYEDFDLQEKAEEFASGARGKTAHWRFVVDLFQRNGLPPPTKLRDEIVTWRASHEELIRDKWLAAERAKISPQSPSLALAEAAEWPFQQKPLDLPEAIRRARSAIGGSNPTEASLAIVALAEENRVLREALKFGLEAISDWPDECDPVNAALIMDEFIERANAALSTAHPSAQAYREAFGEMLAALKKIQAYIDDAPSPFESAEANQCVNEVIAKAEALK